MKKLFAGRFSLLLAFILTYLMVGTSTRIIFYFLSWEELSFSVGSLLKMFSLGILFDAEVSLCFSTLYIIFLLLLPSRLIGSLFDKVGSFFIMGLTIFIMLFAFFSEFPFWDEFSTRFNFIAVDYLIYTYEVVQNINESLPIPLIVGGLLLFVFALFYFYDKKQILQKSFSTKPRFINRLKVALPMLLVCATGLWSLNNRMAEGNNNVYENELSKNGVFSLFAAYRSNELDYNNFYPTLKKDSAYQALAIELLQNNSTSISDNLHSVARNISDTGEQHSNIVLIAIESFSADFLAHYGNKQHLTPIYDDLMDSSINFTKLYATGTRTVRGMEALTLCVPPTPGNSIVRRPNNDQIFSIATVLKTKNYDLKFIYGGDGYFDNMNTFFGGQGFDIVDRNRGNPLSDKIKTHRFNIEDKDVSFENAWGICDGDIYKQALHFGDNAAKLKQPFFQFIMTTSNHKPFSFPAGKINLAAGNREAAIKYTDYALGKFFEEARQKSWFANTIFLIVADHCASSAGKWEINIDRHHIPAIIYNYKGHAASVDKLSSQIDLMPTVFGLLHWTYRSELFGKDIMRMLPSEERALIGNYRTLGLLKQNIFTQINDRKIVAQYSFDSATKAMKLLKGIPHPEFKKLSIAYYQTASERFTNGWMKEKSVLQR